MVTPDALATWMSGMGLCSGSLENITPLTGGSQNVMSRFSCDGRNFVLRQPPSHPRPNSNATLRREARILGALSPTDVPHPRLIAVCDDPAVSESVFFLMEAVDGFNPVNGLPALHAHSPDVRRRMGLALVEGIVALGAVDYQAVGLEGFGRPEAFLERQAARWQAQLTGYGEHAGWPGIDALPDVALIANWLEETRPAGFTPGIMHGDYHLANVMYCPDNGELAAIVDWELSTIGDPLVDLGWLLATWPDPGAGEGTLTITPWDGFPSSQELIDHYRARSTRDLSRIDWYAVLACYKLGILLEGTFARACAGKAPMDMGQRLHERALRLFDRATNWIKK